MANSFLRLLFIVALCLVAGVVGETESRGTGPEEPSSRGVDDEFPDEAKTMRECEGFITECGTTDKVKVITRPVREHHVRVNVTTTVTTRLPDITNTITKIDFTTRKDRIQGHCRNTTIYIDPSPRIVTEYVTMEEIMEIVSVVNTTTTEIRVIHENTIEQCYIPTPGLPSPSISKPSDAEVTAHSQSISPPVGIVEDSDRDTTAEPIIEETQTQQVEEYTAFSDSFGET
ncbi:hypothetical protein FLONG3_524 [Fusarium longipes]|uniref:Uncharacterized protein n=1 Tax=Fusarium longipes TaxID=694270 RepID=A0A395T9H5_9HYPO|nr:hypothetical protein FLONG3_524 [Fusarium longipes]